MEQLYLYLIKIISWFKEVPFLISLGFALIISLTTKHYARRVKNEYNSITYYLNVLSNKIKDNEALDNNTHEDFGQNNIVYESWCKFKKNIREIKNKNKQFATKNAEDFFNKNNLTKNIKNIEIIKALPGILTACGLLGTFFAILLSLMTVDPDQVETIETLVSGLAGKFISSIAALACSIWFIWQEKAKTNEINIACYNLHQILEEKFPFVNEIRVLLDIMYHTKETNENVKKQCEILEKVTDIEEGIKNKLKEQSEALKEFNNHMQQNSLESIQKMVGLFQETLSAGAEEQFTNIVKKLTVLSDTVTEVQKNQDIFAQRMESINMISEGMVNSQNQIINNMQNAVTNIATNISAFSQIIEDTKHMHEELSSVSGEIAYAGEQFVEAGKSFEKIENPISNLADGLNRNVEQYRKLVEDLQNLNFAGHISEFKDSITNTLKEIQAGLMDDSEILKDNFSWYNDQLEKLVETADETIARIHSSMEKYSETTSKFLKEYDDSVAKTVNYLNTNINAIDDTLKVNIESLDTNLSILNDTIKSAVNAGE